MTGRDGRVLIRVGLLRNNAGEHGADTRGRYRAALKTRRLRQIELEIRIETRCRPSSEPRLSRIFAAPKSRMGEARGGKQARGTPCSFTAVRKRDPPPRVALRADASMKVAGLAARAVSSPNEFIASSLTLLTRTNELEVPSQPGPIPNHGAGLRQVHTHTHTYLCVHACPTFTRA